MDEVALEPAVQYSCIDNMFYGIAIEEAGNFNIHFNRYEDIESLSAGIHSRGGIVAKQAWVLGVSAYG